MTKKIVLLLLFILVTACTMTQLNESNQPLELPNTSAQQPVPISMEGTLLKSEWLRLAPSYRGRIIKKLTANSTVEIDSVEGDWYRMQPSAQFPEGWLPSMLVSISIPEGGNQIYTGRIHKAVNIRSGPSTSHRKVGVADIASPVQIVSAKKNWYQVNMMNGQVPKTGWIRSDFITVNLPNPAP